jgi:predicted transcriptional regulator
VRKKREKYEVFATLLELVLTNEPIGITKLMYHSYLTYRPTNLHLAVLTREGVLSKDKLGLYRITARGRQVLSILTEMNEMLKPMPSEVTGG